jgi:hypothetical protein
VEANWDKAKEVLYVIIALAVHVSIEATQRIDPQATAVRNDAIGVHLVF